MLLPQKLVLGNDTRMQKQTTISIKQSGYLGAVIEQWPLNMEFSLCGSNAMRTGNSKKTWICLLMNWGTMTLP